MGANAHRLYLVNMQDWDSAGFWTGDLHWACMQWNCGTFCKACLVGKHAQGDLHSWVTLLEMQECEIVKILASGAGSSACSIV